MLLTDLPNDAIVLILARLERAHDVARTAPACRALRDAAGPAQGARRRVCREQLLATLRSLEDVSSVLSADEMIDEWDAAVYVAEKLVTNERIEDQFAAAEIAVSIVDDAFREAPPERHRALMIYIQELLMMHRTHGTAAGCSYTARAPRPGRWMSIANGRGPFEPRGEFWLPGERRSRFIGPLVKRLPRILETAFGSATELMAPELKRIAATWVGIPPGSVSWDPDLRDALDRFVGPS